MPGDKNKPKCTWERERRERLNMSFFKLSKLLPDHDPTLTLSKIEIITKATEYIQQLKNENMQLIIDSDNISGAQKNEMNHLSGRVANLLRRIRQLADLLQAADIPIPSEMPPHESEFPLKPPSKWSGRISKDTAKEILENIKKKREEKEKIHKEKQKIIKEKRNTNNLTRHKKAKSKVILKPSVKATHQKKCPNQDMLGLHLNVAPTTSNTATPLRELNNALHEKTLSYPKTLTLPCTTISLVISNTKTSIVSVAKSNILTAPIMATGIQPVLERNPALSNLGPGTLILPDGRIMPVPPPAPAVLTAATQIIVNRPTQPAVIVMQNNLNSVKQNKTHRVLIPKPKTKDSTKTTFVNKVPIPAIKAHDTCVYVESSTDQLNVATNVKKQKVSLKSIKNKSTIKIIEKITKTDVNMGIKSDKLNKQQNIVVKVNSNQQKNLCKKRKTNTEDIVSCKKIKVNEVVKSMDKSENKSSKDTSSTNKHKQDENSLTVNQNNNKHNEVEMVGLKLCTIENKTIDKELQPPSHTEDEGSKEKKQNESTMTDRNNDNPDAFQDNRNFYQNVSDSKLNGNNSNISRSNSEMAQASLVSINSVGISCSESINNSIIGSSIVGKNNHSFTNIIETTIVSRNSCNQTDNTSLNTICAKESLHSNPSNHTSAVDSTNIEFEKSVVINRRTSFDAKSNQNSMPHGVLNDNEITRSNSNSQIGDLNVQKGVNSNVLNTSTNQIKTIDLKTTINCPSKTDNFAGQKVTNVVDNTLSQNLLDPKMFTNNFSVQTTQRADLGVVNSSQNYYSEQINVDVRSATGLHINQNHNIHKVGDMNNAVNNSSKQTSNENIIMHNKTVDTQIENLNCPDHATYLPIATHIGDADSRIYQTTTDSLNIMNGDYNMKENFSYQMGIRGSVDSSSSTSNCSVLQANTNRTRIGTQNEKSPISVKFGSSVKQQANINSNKTLTNPTKVLNEPIRGSLDSSNNTLNDQSSRQTNMNIIGTMDSSTSMQTDHARHTSTDYRSPSNSSNDHSAHGNLDSRSQQDQTNIDFKYPMVGCTNHSIHYTSNTGSITNNCSPINIHHAKVASTNNCKNSLTEHSVQIINNGATMNNQFAKHSRVSSTNNSKNMNHLASQVNVNNTGTIGNSKPLKVPHTDNSFHNVSSNHSVNQTLDQRNVSVSTNNLSQIDNSTHKPSKEARVTLDKSTLHQPNTHFTSQTYNTNINNSQIQPVHQPNKMCVGTFTNTQTSQTNKSLCQGTIDYGSHPQSSLNDFRICPANMPDFLGNINSSNQNDNSACQTATSASAINNQTSSDFINLSAIPKSVQRHSVNQSTIGETIGSSNIKPDSVCQINTNFRTSASSLNTLSNQSSQSINTKGSVIGSANVNNNQVQEDFRSSYKCSIVQSNSNHQLNRDSQNSGNIEGSCDHFIHPGNNTGAPVNQASITFIGATFSCANNSVHPATNSKNTSVSNQTEGDKSVQLTQRDNQVVETNLLNNHSINQRGDKDISACNYNQLEPSSVQKVKEGNSVVSASENTQKSTSHKSGQIGKKSSVQTEQKSTGNENLLKISSAPQMPNCEVKLSDKDYMDVHGRGKNSHQDKEKNKHLITNNNFNISSSKVVSNVQDIGFNDKTNDLGAKTITKEQQVQCFSEDKTVSKKENQKQEFNMKKTAHEVSDSMKLQSCTENVFRDLNYRDRNSFIPINHCMDEMRLTLSNTDFSSDLFSSLQVPSGGQHPESISPTAAFLLAFPLVSTSKTSEMLAENENSDSQHATPTTILQIGNIDPPGSELYQSMENSLQFQNSVKTKHDGKTDKQEKFQQFEMNERISQNYTHFRTDESYDKNSCKQKKSNFMVLEDQELFMSCDKKSNSDKNCPYFSQTSGNFTGVAQNVQQNNSSNQPTGNPKKANPTNNVPGSQYPYNQPYYNLFPSNIEFSANVTSSLTTQTSNEPQKVESQNSNQNNFTGVLSWTTPMTTSQTSHLEHTIPYTTFSQKTHPYLNQSNGKQNHLQHFERKDKQNSTLPKFATNFQFGNNARNDLPQYHASENNLNFKDSKLKKSKTNQTNQHRPPVNWMTTPDIRPVLPDHMTALLPDVIYSSKEIDLIPSQNTILNSCSNIPPFNLPTSISNNQTLYPNSHYSGIDLPLDLPSFPEISATKQTRNNQHSSQYSWSPNKATIPLLPHLDSHNLAIPSTLPTLVGDLALGTNTGPPTPAENFKSYSLPNNFVGNTAKRCDTKQQECQKSQNKSQDKDCLIPTNNERRNSSRTDYCKTLSNQSTNTTGSFLSVSQLVDQVKSDRNVQRRSSKPACKSQSAQKRSTAHNDKHNMKNITSLNNYPINNNNNNIIPQRKNENNFIDDRNKNVGYPGIFPSSNIPHSWQTGKMNTNSVQFKGGSYSAESLIGVNSDTNIMNHDNVPEVSQFPSNQFNNQYNNSSPSTNNTYNTDFPEYSQTQQPYQNCFNFTSQNSIYTSTTTAPFLENDYQLNLDSSYVFHHPSTNTSCQTNQSAKDRSVQSTKRNHNNKRRDDYTSVPVNQSTPSFLQTPQMYPPSSQYVNSRNNSAYQPTLSCVSGNNTTSSLANHGTTTLTNFNLTTIFPEMNVDDKRAVSGSNTYHPINSKHDVNTTVAQPGVRTDSVDNHLPSMRPGFNNIVHPQSLKSEQCKDEYHIIEIDNEIRAIEPIYNSMYTELEQSPTMAKYVSEISRIWDALKKSHTSAKMLSELAKDNYATISAFNLTVTAAGEATQSDQKLITKLQQEVERALRMVDTAHTREQVAQETVENLRQQILRLHQELEQKTKSLEQDGEYSSIAKNKEALMKERERMTHEIAVLKEKLHSSAAYQEELERKNSQADLRVAELTQELENQTNEMSKEARFKERFEDDLMQVKKELVDRELEITQLNAQLAEYHRSMTVQQNVIKEQKNLSDKLNQSIETHQQRILKLGDDLQKEVAVVEICNQKINVLEKQLKLKDDLVTKLILDLSKTSKVQDSFKTKLNRMEAVKNEIATQKKKLQTEIEALQRQIDNDKRALDTEKRKVEDLAREKEIISKSSLKTASMLDEQLRLFKIQEQARFHLEQELDNNRYEVSRQVQELLAMEKEKDRYISETVVLTKKVEATLEDVRLKQSENYEYRKKLALVETQLANKHNQWEVLRYELNTCSKNLLEAQDDISDLKQKGKVMTLQIEQLKDDIAGKETQLIREQLALRKAHGEKEAMRVEIQKSKDQLDQANEKIKQLNTEIESMNNILRRVDVEKERDRKEKEKIMNEKDILSTQLVRRNDEVVLLREKLKIFQSTMDKEDLHYAQRLEDIRLLKLEVQRLTNEKNVLSKSLDNMVDLRVEVHHLEKNLTKERLKSRALEDEQLNPLNVHRWRKLEGSDPAVHELVQKVNLQQRRILEQMKSMLELQEKYNNLEKQYQQSLLTSKQPLSEDPVEIQRELKAKENKVKGLTAEISMRETQAAEYKAEIEKLNQELVDYKKKFYDQKQKTEKLGQKLAKVAKPEMTVSQSKLCNETEISTNKKELPALPHKPRFTGGGFNMGVAAS